MLELIDPCPLPTKDSEKKRKMGDRNKVAYAPMSGGGGQGVTWDGERVWINTSGHFSKRRTEDDQQEGDCEQLPPFFFFLVSSLFLFSGTIS